MRPSKTIHRLLAIMLAALTAAGSISMAAAQSSTGNFTATALTPESQITGSVDGKESSASVITDGGMASVFIKMSDPSLASYLGESFSLTSPEAVAYLASLNAKMATIEAQVKAKAAGAVVTHRFDVILGGIAMLVPASQIDSLKTIQGVERVELDRVEKVQTDTTPSFIGATRIWNQLGGQKSAGEGVIVGVLDSGIWPEHPSFSDPDPFGKPYAAPEAAPGNPGGTRACVFGSATPGDAPFACTNKLIGAYRFMSTYQAVIGLVPGEFVSARDDDGHGSHTASTAAGNGKVAASIFGISRGIISGIAPRAHVVAYKVCGVQGCFGTDSAAAVQQSIRDGVDVLNFSISGGANPFADVVSLAFLDAYNAGIFVAASAGNSGPGADTTDHREPWVATVAASTAPRAFKNTLTLSGAGGATLILKGTSVTTGISTPTPVVVAPGNIACDSALAAGSVTGQIVICQRGGATGRVQKGINVLAGGAAGMILYNQAANITDQQTDNHFLPTTQIQFAEGQQVLAFLAANSGATATLTAGLRDTQQGDVMASFSSRGGPGQTLGVSKPDITAPGVQILAAHTPLSVDAATGPQGELFQSIAGTSMSSPHIAGSAALVKALHPTWTPGQIKSALMLTAKTTNLFKEDGVTPFTPFDAGSGRVELRDAGDPGLSISETGANFLALRNELWKANYPSIYVPTMPGKITVTRTFEDVSGYSETWNIRVRAPKDLKITVPQSIYVHAYGKTSMEITIDAKDVPIGEVRHATITLNDGHCTIHIPITIVRKAAVVTLAKACDPATIRRGGSTTCSITMANTTFDTANVSMVDTLPSQLWLIPSSVVNGVAGNGKVSFEGTLAGASPANVFIASDPGGSPGGYLPLGLPPFNIAPIAGQGDETAANFTVPAFSFGGETYTRIGMTSNGYAVIGGTNGSADIQFINQSLPDANRPNNVLAPFWTDLNLSAPNGGAMRIGVLTGGGNSWIVLEWENAREFSTNRTASFQIWIGINSDANPEEDITFTYGTVTGNGDGGFMTVGAENRFGNRGQNYYVDGVGTLPTFGTELRVSTVPGAPGETRTVTFQAKGDRVGSYVNYAELKSNLFDGTSVARFQGTVTR